MLALGKLPEERSPTHPTLMHMNAAEVKDHQANDTITIFTEGRHCQSGGGVSGVRFCEATNPSRNASSFIASALECKHTPISMFRSWAASVKFAEVTNKCRWSTTTALAWNDARLGASVAKARLS